MPAGVIAAPFVIGIAYGMAGLPFIVAVLVMAGEFIIGWGLGLG